MLSIIIRLSLVSLLGLGFLFPAFAQYRLDELKAHYAKVLKQQSKRDRLGDKIYRKSREMLPKPSIRYDLSSSQYSRRLPDIIVKPSLNWSR